MNIKVQEPGFRDSVDLLFNRAVKYMNLTPGLIEKIRVCNSTYTVRFGVRLRGKIDTFTGYRSVHSEHTSRSRAASAMRCRSTRTRSRRWRR